MPIGNTFARRALVTRIQERKQRGFDPEQNGERRVRRGHPCLNAHQQEGAIPLAAETKPFRAY